MRTREKKKEVATNQNRVSTSDSLIYMLEWHVVWEWDIVFWEWDSVILEWWLVFMYM